MASPIIIERVTPSHAGKLKAVRLRALQDAPLAFGSTYEKESRFADSVWAERASPHQDAATFLGIDLGIPCGIIRGSLVETNLTQSEVTSMWVAPTHRRSGVGRLLFNTVEDWARAKGSHALRLMVTSCNQQAIAFYEKLGFVLTGQTEPYPNDPNLVELEMIQYLV